MIITLFDGLSWQAMFVAWPWLWVGLSAFVGALLASFGGVVVDRLPRAVGWPSDPDALGMLPPDPTINLITPSRCGECAVRLDVLALVPVVGWLIRRGRCFSCGAPVPWRYPAIEAATALASAIFALHFGPTEAGAWALCALWACVVMSWMDLAETWIPARITIPMVLAGLVGTPFEATALSRNVGFATCVGLMWLVSVTVGRWRGLDEVSWGDVALLGVGGAWLGIGCVPAFILIMFPFFAVYEVPRRLLGRFGSPMGPAICLSFLLCLWLGDTVKMMP